jgi:hypothetical protein
MLYLLREYSELFLILDEKPGVHICHGLIIYNVQAPKHLSNLFSFLLQHS